MWCSAGTTCEWHPPPEATPRQQLRSQASGLSTCLCAVVSNLEVHGISACYVPVPVPVALANCARAIIMAVPVAVGPKSCEVAAASAHMGPYTNLTLSDSVQASESSEPADEPAESSDTASKGCARSERQRPRRRLHVGPTCGATGFHRCR